MFPRPIIRKFYLRKTRKFFTSASPPLRSTSTAPTAGLLPSSVGAPLIVLDVRAERRCACRSCGDHAASAPCLLLDCAPPQSCLGARAPAAQRRKLRPPLEESLLDPSQPALGASWRSVQAGVPFSGRPACASSAYAFKPYVNLPTTCTQDNSKKT